MRLIDSHAHLYPPEVNGDPAGWAAANREPRWAALCTRRRRDGRPVQAFPGPDGALAAMDEAGVDRAILLGWYWENPGSCAGQNRFLAECVRRHPDRFSAFAAVHPGAGAEAMLAEIRRAREEGFLGLGELSPHAQGFSPDSPVWGEALALAGELGLPVNLHVSDPDGRPYPGRVETPAEDFLRLARRFPRTAFILAHWGGLLPLRQPEAAALPNLHYDTAASPLSYGPQIWARFVGSVGHERVLFGSDFPLNLYPKLDPEPRMDRFVAEARAAFLSSEALAAVLAGNSARLMNFR